MKSTFIPLVSLFFLLSCAAARADLVTLKDGVVREGVIVAQDERTVTLEVRLGALKGNVVIPRSEIASIQRQPLADDPVAAEAARLKTAAASKKGAEAADAWVKVGDYYQGRAGFSAESQAAYEKAIEEQPDHAIARKRLGHAKTEKGWQAVDDERRGRGLVPLDDVWVKPQERAWLIDRRHDEETEELRIGPRRDEPFTKDEVERQLKLRRAQEEVALRERLRLDYGDSLLSRLGYYGYADGVYIGSGYAPYYADGVGIGYGESSAFFGTVGTYGPGYYGPSYYNPYSSYPYPYSTGGTAGSFQRQFGFSPGVLYKNKNFSFAFGTNLSGYGYPYGSGYGYGSGWGFSIGGGSRNFRYNLGFGGFSGSSSYSGSSGFGIGW